MSATYDPGTNVGRVRLLISDVDVDDPDRIVYQDEEIAAFLSMNSGIKRAAAAALYAIANNQLQVDKVIKTQDLSTDAAAVAAELRALAAQYRAQADAEDVTTVNGARYLVA